MMQCLNLKNLHICISSPSTLDSVYIMAKKIKQLGVADALI